MNDAMADQGLRAEASNVPTAHPVVGSTDAVRRWPAVVALVTAWILPATTAERTQHVPLWQAFLLNLVALALIPMAMSVTWGLSTGKPDEVFRAYNDFAEELTDHPARVIYPIGIAFLALQFNILLPLAVLFMPWGAVDERFRSSFRHALRRVWLQSAQLPLLVAFFTVVVCTLERFRRYSYYFNDYNNYQQYAFAWPYYLRVEVVMAWLCAIMVLWWLWSSFRAVGARRACPLVQRPPLCEFCGYNLTLCDPQGNCPECGEPVRSSLGQDVRPGTPWEHRASLGSWRAYWQTCRLALLQPSRLGHLIRSRPTGTHHRGFLLFHLRVIALLAYPCLLWLYRVGSAEPLDLDERPVRDFLWITAPLATCCVVAGGLGVASLTALSSGWRGRNEFRRNVLPAAVQIVAYQSLALVIAVLYGALTMMPLLWGMRSQVILAFFRRWHLKYDDAIPLIWCLLILIYAAWYGAIALRGVRAARFANH